MDDLLFQPTRSIDRALSDLIATAERLGPNDPRAPGLVRMIRGLQEITAQRATGSAGASARA
jgi:hypothetical protein